MTLPSGFISAVVGRNEAEGVFFTTFYAFGIEVYPRSATQKINRYPLPVDVGVVGCNTRKVIGKAQCDTAL